MSLFSTLRACFRLGIGLSVSAIIVLSILVGGAFVHPDVGSLGSRNPDLTSFMQYRMSQWREQGRKVRLRKTWVPLSRISRHLKNAVLIGEDDKFFEHDGFDVEAMGEAMERNLERGRLAAGGSTITQQLAKNLFLSPEKTFIRKLREAVLVWRLERALTKERLLEMYLNVAEWGPEIFGIEAASRHYYGIPASRLGPRAASRLAAVLPNPVRFSPVSDSRFVRHRSSVILAELLRRQGLVSGTVLPHRPWGN